MHGGVNISSRQKAFGVRCSQAPELEHIQTEPAMGHNMRRWVIPPASTTPPDMEREERGRSM